MHFLSITWATISYIIDVCLMFNACQHRIIFVVKKILLYFVSLKIQFLNKACIDYMGIVKLIYVHSIDVRKLSEISIEVIVITICCLVLH